LVVRGRVAVALPVAAGLAHLLDETSLNHH
jgi:hypothetical protein